MNRLILFLFLCSTLTGCNDDWAGTVIRFPTVYYVGDSLCVPNSDFLTAQQIVGIHSDCTWGLTLTNRYSLPSEPEASLVFLALGSNDALLNYDPYYYGVKLTEKIAKTSAKVYCVLPMNSPRLYAQPYRDKMLENCENILDPLDFGVDVYDGDMRHWDAIDHENFVNGIISVLTVEGFIETPPLEELPGT